MKLLKQKLQKTTTVMPIQNLQNSKRNELLPDNNCMFGCKAQEGFLIHDFLNHRIFNYFFPMWIHEFTAFHMGFFFTVSHMASDICGFWGLPVVFGPIGKLSLKSNLSYSCPCLWGLSEALSYSAACAQSINPGQLNISSCFAQHKTTSVADPEVSATEVVLCWAKQYRHLWHNPIHSSSEVSSTVFSRVYSRESVNRIVAQVDTAPLF